MVLNRKTGTGFEQKNHRSLIHMLMRVIKWESTARNSHVLHGKRTPSFTKCLFIFVLPLKSLLISRDLL